MNILTACSLAILFAIPTAWIIVKILDYKPSMNYRILTDGKTFRIQKRFLFFWWRWVRQYKETVVGSLNLPVEYDKVTLAQYYIEGRTRKPKVKWEVVKFE